MPSFPENQKKLKSTNSCDKLFSIYKNLIAPASSPRVLSYLQAIALLLGFLRLGIFYLADLNPSHQVKTGPNEIKNGINFWLECNTL